MVACLFQAVNATTLHDFAGELYFTVFSPTVHPHTNAYLKPHSYFTRLLCLGCVTNRKGKVIANLSVSNTITQVLAFVKNKFVSSIIFLR